MPLQKGAEAFVMDAYTQTCVEADILPGTKPEERRMKEMVNLNFRWFMQTLLDRKDRMSMHHALEVRVPFCDYRIAEYLYGVPWDFKDYRGREKGLLRAELGLADNAVIVGMVAYMYAPKKYLGEKRGLKGHEDLIDAVALIQDKYPDLHLVIIGGPWVGADKYAEEVIAYGKEKVRNIHFLGTRTNVPDLYQDFDMVVHPSHSENLGGAAESLMLAVPTIASNVGGFPDIVIPGKTGYLVNPSDPQSIAAAIETVIADPQDARRLAEYGRTYLRDLLNAKKTSKDVYDFYRVIEERYNKRRQ